MKDAAAYRNEARLFRALSHPVRLRILEVLAHQEACVCHLTAMLRQRQPYVSQQLAALREAGLVRDRRDATLIYYSLADESLAALLREGKNSLLALAGEELSFAPVPEGPVANCPCPQCHSGDRA